MRKDGREKQRMRMMTMMRMEVDDDDEENGKRVFRLHASSSRSLFPSFLLPPLLPFPPSPSLVSLNGSHSFLLLHSSKKELTDQIYYKRDGEREREEKE